MTAAAADFFVEHQGPFQQGDLVVVPISRTVASDLYCPPAWEGLETQVAQIPGAKGTLGDAYVEVGLALSMITSHDCQLDKDWNREWRRLVKSGISENDAWKAVDADPTLDRTLTVSPLIKPEDLSVDQGNLLSGKIVGYLPVPEYAEYGVARSVVDLSYRSTVDRLDVVARVIGVTEIARAQLRYAINRMETLRSSKLGFVVEEVLGRSIVKVEIPKNSPLTVVLHLDDGSKIELLQQPAEPEPAPSRSGANVPRQIRPSD